MVEITGALPWGHQRDTELDNGGRLDFAGFFTDAYHETLGIVAAASGRRSVAEDATQEAFARALARWDSVSRMSRPDRWVVRVALNLVVDTHRRRRREAELDADLAVSPGDGVEELWVRWNLDRLTPMQRVAVVRRYIDGMPVEEVARSLGRSVNTIKTHLRLGRSRLRDLLQEDR